MTRISDFLTSGAERAASRQQSKKTHTEKVGESRSPKQMTKDAKKEQKKAAKEAGKGFKDSFKDTACSVKSAGKTLVNATGINGKQKKEQAVDKIYGITRGIGTTIAHPIRSVKEIASAIREKAKEKGESYVGGYILGEVTQTAAAAGAAAAAGKGLKGAKAAKKTKPKKSNGLADVGSKSGTSSELKVIGTYDNNNYFNRAVEFNAGSEGTGFTYKVYQRNDIDWNMVRTTGAKKGRGLTNAQAAEKYGLAPILNDGYVVTLHHSQQRSVGPLFEASTRYHNISNAKKGPLHPYKGQLNPFNPMDSNTRGLFQKVDSIEYWKARGRDAMKGVQ